MDGPRPAGTGVLESARALGASLAGLAGARLELAAIELQEEVERRKRLLILSLFAGVFLACALLLAAFLVAVVFWDTHRIPAIAAVTLVYAGIGAFAFLRFRAVVRDSPPPFGATLGEFRNDLDMIRGRDG